MAKAAIIIGSVSISIFMICVMVMHLFVHGEEDWDLGIAIVIGVLVSGWRMMS